MRLSELKTGERGVIAKVYGTEASVNGLWKWDSSKERPSRLY